MSLATATTAQARPLRLSLVGAYRSSAEPVFERQEFFAGLSLDVPWPELLAANVEPRALRGRDRDAGESEFSEPFFPDGVRPPRFFGEIGVEPGGSGAVLDAAAAPDAAVVSDPAAAQGAELGGSGAVPDAAAVPARRDARLSLVTDSALARHTVAAALRASGAAASAARLDALGGRARSSAALPELGLSAERAFDQSLRLAPTLTDPYRYTQAGGATLKFEARLTWQLNELVFSRSEIMLARLQQYARTGQAALVELVMKQFFQWQAACVKQRQPDVTAEERLGLWLREFEARARLDVLTAGWFGRAVGPGTPLPEARSEAEPSNAEPPAHPPAPASSSQPPAP